MSPSLLLIFLVGYFVVLLAISHFTSKKADNKAFFSAGKSAKWYVVAFGMIGTSLSGVTFISVPGWVGSSQFTYMQVVLGYLVGYWIISGVLLPLYYKMGVTSIYQVLERRIGKEAYKTGAWFFFISRVLGASFRLYLVCIVLHEFAFSHWNIPFIVTVMISILLIWLYTHKGGMNTIIWTDTLQTLFMLGAVGLTLFVIANETGLGISGIWAETKSLGLSNWLVTDDINSSKHFIKQFVGGALIALTMTGMDQDMMQKNLSCANVKDSQKNMLSFSAVLVFVNFVFLLFGAALLVYANQTGITLPEKTDQIFPTIALSGELGMVVAVLFILGLVAAAYSSADSALTALTTSFYLDILGKDENVENKKERNRVHILVSVILLIVIWAFSQLNNKAVIDELLSVAAFTYGPILGMFCYAIWRKKMLAGAGVVVACLLAPTITYGLKYWSLQNPTGYQFGYELLAINGALTYLFLWVNEKVKGELK